MDGPGGGGGGTVCSTMDGPVGPVIARTIYGVTVHLKILLWRMERNNRLAYFSV